ncbi:ankyrin repeat and SOCS box protein 13 isoform X4 [Sus scrofa]|uniref:ankyrin repeat and SOCS box protein 13 isoform X4 n=1 Tax=Sus scrofa TaxID=9823 RepID=UPI000A2B983F|nr:ankyrin repeat and SOCS box protein 13 isoform X4 [Sus scrofa]
MSLEMYRAGVLREISERVPAGLGGPVVPPPVGAEAVGLLCADHTWQSPGLPDQAAELRIICAEGESPVALGGVIFNLIPGSKCFAVLRASRRSWSPVSLLSPQQVHPQPLCSPPRPGITLGAWRAWDSPRLRFLRRCWVHSNPLLLRNQASDALSSWRKPQESLLRDAEGGFEGAAAGANVNAAKLHETALHHAAKVKNVDLIEMLVQFGGDIYARDNRGRKPSDYARSSSAPARCLEHYEKTPLTLSQLCRVSLRRATGVRGLEKIAKLNIPARLIEYLSYN